MSDTSSVYSAANYNVKSSSSSGTSSFEDLKVEDFLKLMIAELQNQDPLNPMDNSDMLAQINQMRQVVSNDKLSSTLDSILLGQSVATASNLLGKTVTGTNQLGETTTGVVDRVVFEDGSPKVYVGNYVLSMDSITEIVPSAKTGTETDDKSSDDKSSDETTSDAEE